LYPHQKKENSIMAQRPLILVTNDDGIDSPGLHAAAEAVADLGDLLIMAPIHQQSGAGRSFHFKSDNAIYTTTIALNGASHVAYKADMSPAQAVAAAVMDLAQRPIDLCISGINYGENVGSGITASGTVGAALEAADTGIPALAVSLQMSKEFYMSHSREIDFSTAGHFTRLFAQRTLEQGLPRGVDLLKIDVPASATPQTPWRMVSISRQRYFEGIKANRQRLDEPAKVDYRIVVDRDTLEPESDIYTMAIKKEVAVAPMTVDLTAKVTLESVSKFFNGAG
jgi:5'-nucleotidase